MATLDDQLAALQAVLAELEDNLKADIAGLYSNATASDDEWADPFVKQEFIASADQYFTPLVQQYNAAAAQVTASWYDELAPDEPYKAEVPDLDTLLPAEAVTKSISWAINTANSLETSMALMQKSMQRKLMDGSRDTVVHNAKKEKVKYLRHASYANVCDWCLVMATKGAVYTSAAAAVAGHDNCRCIAVPIRKGVNYKPPAEVKDAAKRYEAAVTVLNAEGKQTSLDNILAQMNLDQMAKTAVPIKVSTYDTLPPSTKKTVQNSYSGKKNKAKAKFGAESPEFTSLKGMGPAGYYDLVYAPEHAATTTAAKATAQATTVTNQAQWLAAEAQYNAKTAIANAAQAEKAAGTKGPAAAAAHAEQKAAEAKGIADYEATLDEPYTPLHAIAQPDPPNTATLVYQGGAGGSHGAGKWSSPDGQEFLVKQQSHYKNLIDETTAALQHKTGLLAPNVWTTDLQGTEVSIQQWMPGGNAYNEQIVTNFKANDIIDLQKSQVFDWLVANHDTHAQQWVRNAEGHLVGIDKGQAFKWFGKDKLDWDFHPNKPSGEHEPIYNTLWKLGNQGKINILPPNGNNPVHDYIQGVMAIPDDEFKALLHPMAKATADKGKLVSAEDGHGLGKAKLPANDVEAFLDAAVARKNNLQNDFDALWAKHFATKTGTNPLAPPSVVTPQPAMTADAAHALKMQHKTVAELIAEAHTKAKQGFSIPAADKIAKAQMYNDMPLEEYLTTMAYHKIAGPAPVAPAAKALEDFIDEHAKVLVDLLDAGEITPATLAASGHLVGVKAQQTKEAMEEYSAFKFSALFPEKVAGYAAKADDGLLPPMPYHVLDPATKKTIQNSYSGKKNKAKTKFGPNSNEFLGLKNMGVQGYYEKVYAPAKSGGLPEVPKPAAQTPLADWEQELLAALQPTPVEMAQQSLEVLANKLSADYNALDKDALYKVGNQFSGKKNKAKKGTDSDSLAKQWIYSTWSKKDYWASQQLMPGSALPHPYKHLAPKDFTELQAKDYALAKAQLDEYVSNHPGGGTTPVHAVEQKLKWMTQGEYQAWLLENGQTSFLTSPLATAPKVAKVKVSAEPPPKNPPNDLAKLGKVQGWEQQYKALKPHGTGFNPVKSWNPEGTLKTNIDGFASDIGVGYLTDDQLQQVLVKLTAAQKTKYLKQYADAKGQGVANALAAKVNPPSQPSVVSPPTSAGSSPASMGMSYSQKWKANVQIKPGTKYTPVRQQDLVGAKELGKSAVPDVTAPLGSADNPHVFTHGSSVSNDFKTFGALHTDQNEDAWVKAHYIPVKSYTGAAYDNYNEELRKDLKKMMDDWIDPATQKPKLDAYGKPIPKPLPSEKVQNIDAAFTDPSSKPLEEWAVFTRAASQREFSDNDVPGLNITTGGYNGTVAELKKLVGHTYIQRGIGSTSITVHPAFVKHVRVIYRMPPGSKMVYVDGEPGGGYGTAISSHEGEREVLLPRNSRYKVLEVRDSTSNMGFNVDVIVELVEQEPLG